MARFVWRVTYDNVDVLDEIQNITFTRGRRQIQDTFQAGRATITGRDLSTLPTIEIGNQIVIEMGFGNPLTYILAFVGTVADVQITYGMVPNADSWQIQCEDMLATYGRAYTTSSFSWSDGITTGLAAQLATESGTDSTFVIGGFGSYTSGSTVSAQTLGVSNVLELLNRLAATEQGVLISGGAYGDPITTIVPSAYFVPRTALGSLTNLAIFSDGTHPVGVFPDCNYDQIIFRSYADSFYDRVIVEPAGLAPQVSGSGVGNRAYTMQSYDQTTTQAQNLSDYILATFDVQTQVPSSISLVSESQTTDQIQQVVELTNSFGQVTLYLRGVKYDLFVLGLTVTATPDQTRFTLNVASSEALNFFILDNATYGVLDQNRLGL